LKYAIDASAVLALLNGEAGGDQVEEYMAEGAISAVNLVEVGTRLVDAGMPSSDAVEALRLLGLPVVAFGRDQAELAIALLQDTRDAGLSLGDRACLALGKSSAAAAVTADRAWIGLKHDVAVHLIR
jgi:PIN domain nuclease of toxin-antitoxin system